MKTKILVTFSKGPWGKNKQLNQKGQSLVEALFALQALGAIFVFLCYAAVISWNHLCLHWVTHEATICESLRDSEISCKQISVGRLRRLAQLDQLITYRSANTPSKWSVDMSIEVGFGKIKINRMEIRHVLRKKN